MVEFKQTFDIRWSDVDANAHVRHSAYMDYCASLRMAWLDCKGFSITKLQSLNIGPVLFKETVTYLRELKPDGRVTVQFKIGSLSESGHKWSIDHEILNDKGEVAATLLAAGAWFDTKARRVIAPPEGLLKLMQEATKTENFRVL